ncbi:MAG: hypothetical protein BGN96_03215 [Bacteroidales bacterium 45-6]|nr:MAG: hypothetical protein BGN96_03215 [Bacteroidales bacterium 45-6]
MRKKMAWMLAWLCSGMAWAQSDTVLLAKPLWAVNKATSIGYGSASVYDSYLSPLEYNGNSYSFLHERVSRTHLLNDRLVKQQLFGLNLTSTENPAKNATTYSAIAEYRLGAHYPVWQRGNFRFRAGGVWNLGGGVVYNQRNSNNPASAKAYTNLNVSVQSFFRWKSLLLRWQLDTPVVGVFFTPEYGESYYEVSLGNYPNAVHFASIHNQRALLSYFSADFPVSNWTIRLGLQSSLYQTRANSLVSHLYTHNILIGLVSESLNLSGKRLKKTKIFKSALDE